MAATDIIGFQNVQNTLNMSSTSWQVVSKCVVASYEHEMNTCESAPMSTGCNKSETVTNLNGMNESIGCVHAHINIYTTVKCILLMNHSKQLKSRDNFSLGVVCLNLIVFVDL